MIQLHCTYPGHGGAVYCLAPGRSESTFLSGSSDGFVAEWDLIKGTPESFSINVGKTIYSMLYLPGDRLLIGCGNGDMHLIDLQEKKELRFIQLHKNGVFDLKRLRDGRILSAGGDGKLCIWEDQLDLVRQIPVAEGKVRQIAVNRIEDVIAIATQDGTIEVLDTEVFMPLHRFTHQERSANAVIFHPTRPSLLSGGWDGHLYEWSLEEEMEVKRIPVHNFAIYRILALKEEELLITGSRDKTIKLWDLNTFEPIDKIERKNYDGHANSINALLWHKEQEKLVSAGDDTQIKAWRLTDGQA